MDAAALDIALRPTCDHAKARLLLSQGISCLNSVAYPMRRVEPLEPHPGINKDDFNQEVDRLRQAGFAARGSSIDAWETFATLRSRYAPRAYQLAFWTIAAPGPWSGDRAGFPDLVASPNPPH
jgi:hypothetical protein